MSLVVVAARARRVRPVDLTSLADPLDRALEGTNPGKGLRRQPDTAIKLPQQVFVAYANVARDVPDPQRLALRNHVERATHRWGRRTSRVQPLDEPPLENRKARIVVRRLTESFA